MKPRVLMIGAEAQEEFPGGLNRYVQELATALGSAGVDHRVVQIASAPDDATTSTVAPGPLIARLMGVRREVARLRPEYDVVDSQFPLYTTAPLLTGAMKGKPLLVHFHGPWADESATLGQAGARVRAKRLLERQVYRRADRVVVLSHAFKRLLVERYRVAPWVIEVVRPSVDLERFRPGDAEQARARLGLPAGPLAITVRRLVPRMGLDGLLHAWSRLDSGTLLVVGRGPERAPLEELARRLGMEDRVRFLGGVAEELLPDYYRTADLCLLPSLSLEGFGLVVLEALACGTPVIASDAGGLPEALAGLPGDLVTPRGDVDALSDRLAAAVEHPSGLPSAEQCRSHAELFSRERMGERHRELYSELVEPSKGRRRRVVFLDHCARLSGGELAMANIIDALDVDAHVILGEDGPLVRRLHDSGISVEVLPLPEAARELRREQVDVGKLGFLGPLRTALYIPRLARRLRALRPDLVHANSLKSGLYGSIAARMARLPVVWHLHDRLADDYLPRRAVAFMQRAIRILPTALVTNSEATMATVPKAPSGGAVVVPNPVRPGPARNGRERVERVGMVGRLAPWKGQNVFLEAFARAFPEGPVQATVVGAPLFGEEPYEAELRALAEELGIAGRVEFRGFRPNVGAELERLDVFVHASVVAEPFGQVILEAMAAGVPVAASAGGGASEIASDGHTALLHSPGDSAELADALQRLAADPALRDRLAVAGRERARDFGPEATAERLEALYDALLD